MNFSSLPDTAILKIVQYLPWEECVRVGLVNKELRRFSQLAISKTKSLDLNEVRFRNLTGDQLTVILDLCASNLESIKFPEQQLSNTDEPEFRAQELATVFANYSCPRLTHIRLAWAPIDYAVFHRLIRNNPNMESFQWSEDFDGFPNYTNNNLKKLDVYISNDAALQSLSGRCPNLKEVSLSTAIDNGNVVDQFFASCPQIERIYFSLINNDLISQELVNMWNLPIVSFEIYIYERGNTTGDGVLYKVAESFPHLKRLRLDPTNATNNGVGALAALQELEDLELSLSASGNCDNGIRELCRCKQLRKLSVYWSVISGNTLVTLIRGLPKLEVITIRAIDETEVTRPEEAAVILECLSGIGKRDITIVFCRHFDQLMEARLKSIWDTKAVNDVVKKLEEKEGLKVMIVWR